MITIRIEKLPTILNLQNIDLVKAWCKQNRVAVCKIGILEFVIESEFLSAFENTRNVELKRTNYDNA